MCSLSNPKFLIIFFFGWSENDVVIVVDVVGGEALCLRIVWIVQVA